MTRPRQEPRAAAAIWQRLKERHGFKLTELAKLSGVSYCMLLHCEKGTRFLSLRSLNKIAKAIGVDPQELLGEETIKASYTEEERAARNRELRKSRPYQGRKDRRVWREKHRVEYRRQDSIYKKAKRGACHQLWLKILEHYQGKCVACGSSEKVVRDHVLPVGRGGDNNPGNLQPLCFTCNGLKRGTATDYRPDRGAWCVSLMPALTGEG